MTATPQQCFISIPSANAIDHIWCMYQHDMWLRPEGPPETVFIHTCRLIDVYLMREARSNTEWIKLAYEGNYPITIRVEHTFTDRITALNFTSAYIRALPTPPRCNLQGFNVYGASRVLQCSDGRTFANQAAAARALGCSASAISQHLTGKLATVCGFKLSHKVSQ